MVFGANWSSGAAGGVVGCKVIEGVISRKPCSAVVLDNDLAQRRVQDEALHETNVVLLSLFWQGVPFSSQTAFFGSRVTDQPFSLKPIQDLRQVQRFVRHRRCRQFLSRYRHVSHPSRI